MSVVHRDRLLLGLSAVLFIVSGVLPEHSGLWSYAMFGGSLALVAVAASLRARRGVSVWRNAAISGVVGSLVVALPLAAILIPYFLGEGGFIFVPHYSDREVPLWAAVLMTVAVPAALFAAAAGIGHLFAYSQRFRRE